MTKMELIACVKERFPRSDRNLLLKATKESLERAVEQDHAGFVELTLELCCFEGCPYERLLGKVTCKRHRRGR